MRTFQHEEEVSIVPGEDGRFETTGHLWQQFPLHPSCHPGKAQAEQPRALLRKFGEHEAGQWQIEAAENFLREGQGWQNIQRNVTF